MSRRKASHSKRLLLLPHTPAPQTGVLVSEREGILQHAPPQSLQNQPKPELFPLRLLGGTLCQPGLQDHAYLGPDGIPSKWDLLSQTCSTGAFPALWELMTLSANEGQGWQSCRSGSQRLCGPRLLLSRCATCQVISDAPGVQNGLIHKLCDLPRVRLLGPGQRIRESSLQVGPGRGGRRVSLPPTSD